ncbi:MAG: formylmethanofuran dehydrogenase subunit C [Anaerolineaceae bacterium]|nr:formylmethanofuran dehydrogenase subunit C [Anaerolineaceae bacterium]
MRIVLNFHPPDMVQLDVRSLLGSNLLGLSQPQIEKLPLQANRQAVQLGDVCRVTRELAGQDEVFFCGETRTCTFVARGMPAGKLEVEGGVGYGAGMEMSGGELVVHGSASDCLGVALRGGCIRVDGNAGDWVGAAHFGQDSGMTGGSILVGGSTGSYTGVAMRRGLIWVAGNTGEYTGERILAGTIVCTGSLGRYAGLGMRRGSIVAGRTDSVLPGFSAAGRADDEWLRIYFKALSDSGIHIPAGWQGAAPNRFSGDHLEMGKGEILVYESNE